MTQRRFIVLSTKWMYNAEAEFDKKTKQIVFKKMKWKTPIEVIIQVILSMTDDRITLTLMTDLDKQNEVLVQNGFKKIKKNKRKLQFPDVITARDFLFHIKRIYHLWNLSNPKLRNVKNKPIEVIDKIGQK